MVRAGGLSQLTIAHGQVAGDIDLIDGDPGRAGQGGRPGAGPAGRGVQVHIGTDHLADTTGGDAVEVAGDDHGLGQGCDPCRQGVDLMELPFLSLERPGAGQVGDDEIHRPQRGFATHHDGMQPVRPPSELGNGEAGGNDGAVQHITLIRRFGAIGVAGQQGIDLAARGRTHLDEHDHIRVSGLDRAAHGFDVRVVDPDIGRIDPDDRGLGRRPAPLGRPLGPGHEGQACRYDQGDQLVEALAQQQIGDQQDDRPDQGRRGELNQDVGPAVLAADQAGQQDEGGAPQRDQQEQTEEEFHPSRTAVPDTATISMEPVAPRV